LPDPDMPVMITRLLAPSCNRAFALGGRLGFAGDGTKRYYHDISKRVIRKKQCGH
jgi:hypothetical protein